MKRLSAVLLLCAVSLWLSSLLATGAGAATYTFNLPCLLGKRNYPPSVTYQLDTGVKFSLIDSITLHAKGTCYYSKYDGSLISYSIAIEYSAPFHGYPSYGGQTNNWGLVGQSAFDISGTWRRGDSAIRDALLSDMNNGVVVYGMYLMAMDGSWDGSGWFDPDTATYSVTGQPVPEPSSILALLTGLAGIGGMMIRRRK